MKKRIRPTLPNGVRLTMLNDIVERDFVSMSNNEILAIARLAYKRELRRLDDDKLSDRYCDAFGITNDPTYIEMVGVREA